MPAEDVTGTLKSLTSGEKSPLGNLLQSGDVDKAAQMAYAVLSMVDKSEGGMDSGDKKSVSNALVHLFIGLKRTIRLISLNHFVQHKQYHRESKYILIAFI